MVNYLSSSSFSYQHYSYKCECFLYNGEILSSFTFHSRLLLNVRNDLQVRIGLIFVALYNRAKASHGPVASLQHATNLSRMYFVHFLTCPLK